MYHYIGEAIKYYRGKTGVSRATLAEKLGVSVMTISNYENGVTLPDMETVVTMAHFFSCTTDELLCFSPLFRG